ncbi:MAG: SulA-like leucine-rich domain-containing protein [Psychromonas sp.]
MLSRYQQQKNNGAFNLDANRFCEVARASRLTLSYDLNNYQPLLSHLQTSDDPRWILFIAPPGKPNIQFLQQAGINKSRIITLNQKQLADPQQLFKEAIASNNYAAVIHWVSHCDNTLMTEIEQLSGESKTHCFVYCAQ